MNFIWKISSISKNVKHIYTSLTIWKLEQCALKNKLKTCKNTINFLGKNIINYCLKDIKLLFVEICLWGTIYSEKDLFEKTLGPYCMARQAEILFSSTFNGLIEIFASFKTTCLAQRDWNTLGPHYMISIICQLSLLWENPGFT